MLFAFIDGGCAPVNPGGTGGYGLVISKDDLGINRIYESSGSTPPSSNVSNNVCEYQALLKLLDWMDCHPFEKLLVLSDSKLLVKQMQGKFAIRSGLYYNYAIKARDRVMNGLKPRIKFLWIPRDKNIADELSSRTINEYNRK